MKYNKSMAEILREMYEATFVDNMFDANKPMAKIKADAKKYGVTIKVKKGGGRLGADQATISGSESGIIKYAQNHLDASKRVRSLRDLKKELGEQETDPVAKAQANLDKQKKIADLKKQIATVKSEALDQDDAPAVKDLIKNLRKGSKTHAKQADDLEKELTDAVAQKDAFVVTGGKGDNDQKVIGVFKDEKSAKKARDDYNKKNKPAKKSHRARVFKQSRLSQAGKRFKPGEKIGYMTYSNKAQFTKLKETLEEYFSEDDNMLEFTSSQIARLKKEFEPLKGKVAPQAPEKFAKLRKIIDRLQKPNLLALAKADIPILSSAAKAQLVLKFGMKWKQLPEEFLPYIDVLADDTLDEQKGKFKEVDPKVIDRIEKLMRGTRAEKDSIANMLNYFMPPEVVDMVRYKLKIVPKRGKIKF